MHRPRIPELSPLEFHVLLALAGPPLYGYAIRSAVVNESSGTLNPPAGSLYRVIGRLMGNGFVRETAEEDDLPPHPGLPRKYYTLTATGRRALAAEAHRLKHAALVAEKRLRIVPGRS